MLIVDAQFPIALQMQSIVAELGCGDTRIAGSVTEAESILDGMFRPALAILDLGLEAFGLARVRDRLRAAGAGLVLTSTSSLAEGHGADVVQKPYVEGDLIAAILAAAPRL